MRILLVEDNPDDADLIEATLARAKPDWTIERTDRLERAMAFLGERQSDLVLLDLNLPDSTGDATYEAILNAYGLEIPVVVLTGQDNHVSGLRAVRAGAQDYLTKNGLNPETLDRALVYAVERHKMLANQVRLREALEVEIASLEAIRNLQAASPKLTAEAIARLIRVKENLGRLQKPDEAERRVGIGARDPGRGHAGQSESQSE